MYGVHRFGKASPNYGKKRSEEVKRQDSIRAKKRFSLLSKDERKHTEETKQLMRDVWTDEKRQKKSEDMTNMWTDEKRQQHGEVYKEGLVWKNAARKSVNICWKCGR